MNVFLLADPEIPVPPKLYGGIERIVDLLAHQLVARGHQVTVFAHPDSQVPCRLVPWRGSRSQRARDTAAHVLQLAAQVARVRDAGLVVHSFARLAYMLPLLPLPFAKLQTYQRAITPRSALWGDRLSRGTLQLTACSDACWRSAGLAGSWTTVHNAVPIDRYDFVPSVAPDAPLMFLGRVERIKGPHHALAIAQRTGRRLVIAGNLPASGPDAEYAREVVAACDGSRFVYAGPVDDARKNALLGAAACLLMPIEWEEPFGIVMAEALACGTPVLGLRRGSVPEVVLDGVTGFVRDDVEQLAHAVEDIGSLDRARCREDALRRFSGEAMTDAYERVYADALRRVGRHAG